MITLKPTITITLTKKDNPTVDFYLLEHHRASLVIDLKDFNKPRVAVKTGDVIGSILLYALLYIEEDKEIIKLVSKYYTSWFLDFEDIKGKEYSELQSVLKEYKLNFKLNIKASVNSVITNNQDLSLLNKKEITIMSPVV